VLPQVLAGGEMKPLPNLLNADQQAEFDRAVIHWQGVLGLNDWRIERSKIKTRNMAEVRINHVARLATYRVGDWGAAEITPDTISATALHECSHVLLAELKNSVAYGIEGEALDSAEHRVVHVLEKLLLKAA
jgi:hypothetical protein